VFCEVVNVVPSISETIEEHLKNLLAKSQGGAIEIQRNEMAVFFNCVPAQINYVLTTRFTVDHGFLVESKRGGGGYVRILKLPLGKEIETISYLYGLIGERMSDRRAVGIIQYLFGEELITEREAGLMIAAVSRNALKANLPVRDQLTASVLKAMILAVLREKK
jgi:transcriptional regulator CtsR